MLKNKNGELCLQIRIEAGDLMCDPHSCCGGRQAGTAATSCVYTDTHRHCVQRHCWLPATHTQQPQFLNVMLRSQSAISQGTYLQYSRISSSRCLVGTLWRCCFPLEAAGLVRWWQQHRVEPATTQLPTLRKTWSKGAKMKVVQIVSRWNFKRTGYQDLRLYCAM